MNHKTNKNIVSKKQKQHCKASDKGEYYFSLFMVLGLLLGVILDNIALWLPIGVCIGASFQSYKKKNK